LTSEREHYQTELNGYKVKVTHILKEVERLQQLLETFKRENNDLRREVAELKQQLSGGNLREKVVLPPRRTRNCSRKSKG
jgi:regulator of replication initiation timing